MADALIATENSRFYSVPGGRSDQPRPGTDRPGAPNRDQGGATLEQQLAKNLYEQGAQNLTAQAAEGILALKLDATWSKAQILRMYLDDGYSRARLLRAHQCGGGLFRCAAGALPVVAGQPACSPDLFQAPSAYDPFRHADVARARQQHVIDRLVAVGDLTRAEADRVLAEPWGLRPLT